MSERKPPGAGDRAAAAATPDDLPGQDLPRRVLKQALATGKPAHAYLVTGPRGIGKRHLARWWAALTACQQENIDARPCGQCDGCRLWAAGTHPDMQVLSVPEGFVRREQVVEALRHLTLVPRYSPWQVLIIENAETMTPDAAQALLKTLEEPPGSALIMLTAPGPDRLLPTVVSRCQVIALRPVGIAEVAGWLQSHGVPPEKAAECAAVSSGLPGLAWEMVQVDYLVDLQSAVEFLQALPRLRDDPSGSLQVAARFADRYVQREDMQRLVLWLGVLYRDLWVYTLTHDEQLLTMPSLATVYQAASASMGPDAYAPEELRAISITVEKTLRYLDAYGNPRLGLERLLLRAVQSLAHA